MGRNILLRESNQPKIARHVDIGLGGVQRDQFGSLTNAKRRSVNACRLPPDVVDRSEPIEQQLTDDNGLLAAIPPDPSSTSGNRERRSRDNGGALVKFFAAPTGIKPNLRKQRALGLPQFRLGRAPVRSGLADARVALGSFAQRVVYRKFRRLRVPDSEHDAQYRQI